uniref:Uncharacterized protein n=1 Tax=Haptolina ericina TaxID=156174 RepID=A0A7S3BQG3_9EUKA|mmetsp:Transcript_65519/g.146202  ORF Transcript_65519/g.146202 Transcript_65519/m.146202 type:complete len:253 (+) Transcript_65519:1-759(+)
MSGALLGPDGSVLLPMPPSSKPTLLNVSLLLAAAGITLSGASSATSGSWRDSGISLHLDIQYTNLKTWRLAGLLPDTEPSFTINVRHLKLAGSRPVVEAQHVDERTRQRLKRYGIKVSSSQRAELARFGWDFLVSCLLKDVMFPVTLATSVVDQVAYFWFQSAVVHQYSTDDLASSRFQAQAAVEKAKHAAEGASPLFLPILLALKLYASAKAAMFHSGEKPRPASVLRAASHAVVHDPAARELAGRSKKIA